MVALDTKKLQAMPQTQRLLTLTAAMDAARQAGTGVQAVVDVARQVGMVEDLAKVFPDVFHARADDHAAVVGGGPRAQVGSPTGRGVGPIGLRFGGGVPDLPKRDVPVMATTDMDKLHGLAAAFVGKRLDPFALQGAQLDALVAHSGDDYEARRAFTKTALDEWPELSGLGFHSDYQVSALLDQRPPGDVEDVSALRAELAAFVADRSSPEGRAALNAFTTHTLQALEKVRENLERGGPRAVSGWSSSGFGEIEARISVLTAAALQTRAPEAGGAAGLLLDKLQRLTTLVSVAWTAERWKTAQVDVGNDATMLRDLSAKPGLVDEAVKLIRASTTPEQRAFAPEALSQLGTLWEGPGKVAILLPEAYELAKKIHALDHPGEAFAPTFGSHPVLGRLFAFGGKEMTVSTTDAQHPTVTGRFAGARDFDPDREGSAPAVALHAGTQAFDVALPLVTKIEVEGRTVYDATVDGPVLPRTFAAPPELRAISALVAHAQVLGDYNVSKDGLDALVHAAVLGQPVPAGSRVYGREAYDEHHAAGGAARPVPEDQRALAEGYPKVRALMEQGVRGSHDVLEALQGALLGRLALDLLDHDLGPTAAREAAYLGVSAVWQRGYKAWGIDMRELLAAGGRAMSAEIEMRKDENLGTLEALRDGAPALKRTLVQGAMAGLAERLVEDLSRHPAIDARLEPLVRALAGDGAASVRFADADAIALAEKARNAVFRLLNPDPYAKPSDRFGSSAFRAEPLAFLASDGEAVKRAIQANDAEALLSRLDAVAGAAPITFGEARAKEEAIRALAGDLATALRGATAIPWEALAGAVR